MVFWDTLLADRKQIPKLKCRAFRLSIVARTRCSYRSSQGPSIPFQRSPCGVSSCPDPAERFVGSAPILYRPGGMTHLKKGRSRRRNPKKHQERAEQPNRENRICTRHDGSPPAGARGEPGMLGTRSLLLVRRRYYIFVARRAKRLMRLCTADSHTRGAFQPGRDGVGESC